MIIIFDEIGGSPYSKTWIAATMATQSSSVKLTVESVVRGHHVFKEVWDPRIGDQFCLQIEEFNRYDCYAVAIVVDEKTVGHVPNYSTTS